MASLGTSVFRPVVLRVSGHPWFRRLTTETGPGRALAARFVAGETLEDSIRVARELDRLRITAMLDHLGENVTSPALARAAADAYLQALDRIAEERTLDCTVSVKLTQLGLASSSEGCLELLTPVLDRADEAGVRVMVDMESHVHVDRTLDVIRSIHARHPRVGVCLQAYLRRTAEDVFDLPPGLRVRLVKGSYLEPSGVVLGSKREVDESFRRLFSTLLARGNAIDVATHDPALIEGIRRRVDALDNGWSRVEFQMLYGVRRDLQLSLSREGYPIRVYIPYGTEWYPYLTRRLAERPANLWFFASNLLRSGR